MSVLSAAFNVVHNYPGGAEALGPMVGKAGATLSHEVNPRYPTYKFGLTDAVKVTLLSGKPDIVNAFCLDCGYFPPVPMLVAPAEDASIQALMTRAAKCSREFGDVIGQFQDGLADMATSENDVQRLEKEAAEAIAAITDLVQSVRSHQQASARLRVVG